MLSLVYTTSPVSHFKSCAFPGVKLKTKQKKSIAAVGSEDEVDGEKRSSIKQSESKQKPKKIITEVDLEAE